MKSIHTKFTFLMLIALLVCTLIIGGTSVKTAQTVINRDSVQLMSFLGAKEAQEINHIFHSVKQSLDIFSAQAIEGIGELDKLINDDEYLNTYTKKIAKLANTIAIQAEGSMAIYMRFNPDYFSSTAGFYKIINTGTGVFDFTQTTDLSLYSADDFEKVGWYYLPKNAGKPVWTSPYYSESLDADVVSYLIPMYVNNMMIGIVGMDVDYALIKEKVDNISLYFTGYAYLVDSEFNTVYNKNYPNDVGNFEYWESLTVARDLEENGYDTLYGYNIRGFEYRVAFSKLDNGMMLAISAPLREIESTNYKLMTKILVSALVIAFIFWIISSYMAKTIVQPLKALTAAAKEVTNGNLDVNLICDTKDEVGTLSISMQETTNELKKRINYINSLAYTDKLTGTKNNTAYLYEISNINDELKKDSITLGVFLVDINGLKHVNDEYGHTYGNKVIIKVSKALISVFGQNNVYRIGGDEFIVLLKNTTNEFCQRLQDKFTKEINNCSDEIKLSAAIGYTLYDANIDTSYESLFNRADQEMYRKKMEMKELGEISEIL